MLMTPPTSKTTMRLGALTASRNDPGPESFRFVTWMTSPPRPPDVSRPKPSAPGKAKSGPDGVVPPVVDAVAVVSVTPPIPDVTPAVVVAVSPSAVVGPAVVVVAASPVVAAPLVVVTPSLVPPTPVVPLPPPLGIPPKTLDPALLPAPGPGPVVVLFSPAPPPAAVAGEARDECGSPLASSELQAPTASVR